MNKHEIATTQNSSTQDTPNKPDEMFINPFQVPVIEGVSVFNQDTDLHAMVILSSN